jgi:hypothetical protein
VGVGKEDVSLEVVGTEDVSLEVVGKEDVGGFKILRICKYLTLLGCERRILITASCVGLSDLKNRG